MLKTGQQSSSCTKSSFVKPIKSTKRAQRKRLQYCCSRAQIGAIRKKGFDDLCTHPVKVAVREDILNKDFDKAALQSVPKVCMKKPSKDRKYPSALSIPHLQRFITR